MTEIKIFGIRHHGAGSARRLIQAIKDYHPDVVALEMPEDSEDLIHSLNETKHKTPLAFLYYNTVQPEQAIYLPLAVFSPEYQTIRYAHSKAIPLYCIDLPSTISLCQSNFKDDPEAGLNRQQKNMIADPIGYLAHQAGFSDAEHWWESSFEQWTDHEQLFDVIQLMMGELRNQSFGLDDAETLIREIHMRKVLQSLIQMKFKKLAVVCGAWHGPVLTLDFLDQTKEEKLPPLKTIATKSCIIPWTYRHMSQQSGYNAGVRAPVWNEALYYDHQSAASVFLTHAARTLRKKGIDVPPSTSIDAHRLSSNLAILRELPGPGIDELLDAALHTYPSNAHLSVKEFKQELLCGEVTGEVTLSNNSLPFCQLFHQKLKQLRLNRFWKDVHAEQLHLDLRKENQLASSQFLHYCALIELKWASPGNSDVSALGNFHEYWDFQFHPELEIELIRIGLYGNNLESACLAFFKDKLQSVHSIEYISVSLEHSLKSGMDVLWPLMEHKLSELLLHQQDVVELSRLVAPLRLAISLGSIHQIAAAFAKNILDQLIPKLIFSIPLAAQGIQDERAQTVGDALASVQSYFDHEKENQHIDIWIELLHQLARTQVVAARLRGKAWSLLLERKCCTIKEFVEAFNFELSLQRDIPKTALWFDGFLSSPSSIYLMHPEIIDSLNKWLSGIEPDHFEKNLPLLRRSFSRIPQGERRRILKNILSLEKTDHNVVSAFWRLDEHRMAWVDRVLQNRIKT